MSVGSSMRGSCLVLLVVVFASSWTVPPCQAASGPEIDAEVQSTLAEFFAKVGFARALANRSVAILVFPTVLKAGFGIGGEYGEGSLQIRGQTAGYYNKTEPAAILRDGAPQVGCTRLYNVANFEWSRVVQRGLLSGQSGRRSRGFRARASQFDAQTAVFPDGLMWHRRSDSRPTVDGGAHGPAHGSPSANCARIVRDDEVQCPASDRRLHPFSANGAADTGCADAQQGRAAASPGDDGKAAER
jgi:hypothetical protein